MVSVNRARECRQMRFFVIPAKAGIQNRHSAGAYGRKVLGFRLSPE